MAHLTEEEVENIYMQGSFWINDWGWTGSTFDYQAFAVAVQNAEQAKRMKEISEQCTCRYEGSPCPNCRKKANY